MPGRSRFNKSSKPLSKQVAVNRSKVNALYKQVERKYLRTRATSANLDLSSPLVYNLTAVPEGDASDDRSGVKIHVDWIAFKLLLTMNSGNAHEWARVTIVRDTQQLTDASPTQNEVFDIASSNYGIAQGNRYEQKRFVICYDKTVMMNSDTPQRLISGFVKGPKSVNTYYNGSAGTDIQRNGYYLMITGESNVSYGTVAINVDTRFSDL